VQFVGTAGVLTYAQQQLGAESPVQTISALIEYVQSLGPAGYWLYGLTMIFLQVMPIANAFVLVVSAGAIFGVAGGTALALVCSTISATISFQIARTFGRELIEDSVSESAQFAALDKAFGEASFDKTLTLVTLLRVSPVIPFASGNYFFGLSPIPVSAFSLGTLLGCAPGIAAVVSAGSAGAEIAANGVGANPYMLGLGVAATLGAIRVAGDVATEALKGAGVDMST